MAAIARIWECKPRTKAKLEILGNYLGAWFNILAIKGFRHVYYIDGFCGPGEYLGGEQGSPVIAARMASSAAQKFPGFKATLIFVDSDKSAIDHLSKLSAIKKQHPNVRIDIKAGEFSQQVNEILDDLKKNPNSPTFSFIDPFGFGQSPFDTIKLLMHNERSEVFINFWCGYMNRFKSHHDAEVVQKIRNMVGSNDLDDIVRASDPIDALCSAFGDNLKNVGPYTLKFMMRDENNIRDNAFFFCGRQPRGYEKIKEAMWKVDPVNGNSFSAYASEKEARSDDSQADFFGKIPDSHSLSGLIYAKFRGRIKVPIAEIFQWVVQDTETYLKRHARTELEHLLEKGLISAVEDPSGGQRKRRKNTWPDRLLISFKG